MPSGDQLGAPFTVRSPCTISVVFFVATSITHTCESRKLPSKTCGSSRRASWLRQSSAACRRRGTRCAFRRFDHSKPADALLRRRQLIRFAALHRQNPDLRLASGARCRAPRGRRASGRRATTAGADSPRSLNVSWRGVPPAAPNRSRCATACRAYRPSPYRASSDRWRLARWDAPSALTVYATSTRPARERRRRRS